VGGDFYKRCGGWGLEGAFELTAGGVDVAPAGLADEGGDAAVAKAFLEDAYGLRGRFVEGHVGAGVPDDEVDLGAEILQEGDQFVGMFTLVVDAAQQDIFEGDALARA